jgi:hypothetical protein
MGVCALKRPSGLFLRPESGAKETDNQMSPEGVRTLLEHSIKRMLLDDCKQHPKKPLAETSEWNIASYLRGYIKQSPSAPSGYQVDCEYNRAGMGKDPKKISGKRIRPDVLVHKQGVCAAHDPSANWLAVEVKVISDFDGSLENIRDKRKREGLCEDLRKLRRLRSDDEYRYCHTASLVFSKAAVQIALNSETFEELLSLKRCQA